MPKSRLTLNIGLLLIILIIAGVCYMTPTVSAAGTFQVRILAVRMPEECRGQQNRRSHSSHKTTDPISAGNTSNITLGNYSLRDLTDELVEEKFNFTVNETAPEKTDATKLKLKGNRDPKPRDITAPAAGVPTSGTFSEHVTNPENKTRDIKTDDDLTHTSNVTTSESDSQLPQYSDLTITACLAHHQLRPPHNMRCTLGQATARRLVLGRTRPSLRWINFEDPVLLSIPFTFAWPGRFTLQIGGQWNCCSHSTREQTTFIVDALKPSVEWRLPSSRTSQDLQDNLSQPHSSKRLLNSSKHRADSIALSHSKSKRSTCCSTAKELNFLKGLRVTRSHTLASTLKLVDAATLRDFEPSSVTSATARTNSHIERFSSNSLSVLTLASAKSLKFHAITSKEHFKPVNEARSKRRAGNRRQSLPTGSTSPKSTTERVASSTQETKVVLQNPVDGHVVIEVRIMCSENYYRENCIHFCRARDDYLGHSTCTDTGQQVCRAGWTGPECSQAICNPQCLSSRASCPAPNTCMCRHGWSGPHCDQCRRGTGCVHGNCSLPGQCVCQFGWTGPRCDVKLNFCDLHKPCLNGGTCIHLGQHNYTCACAVGYKGRHCEITICYGDFCGKNGVCVVSHQTRMCRCQAEYTGSRCRTTLDTRQIHSSSPSPPTSLLLFSLVSSEHRSENTSCVEMNCTEKNPHRLSPQTLVSKNSSCADVLCDNKTREETLESTSLTLSCKTLICHNNGKCRRSPDTGMAFCACPEPYTGRQCLLNSSSSGTQTRCSSNPCRRRGFCFNTQLGNMDPNTEGFLCECVEGFSGETCDTFVAIDTSICASSPCQNGGTCVEYDGEFLCACRREFRGRLCTKRRKNRRVTRLKVKIQTTFYSPSVPPSSSSSSSSSSLSATSLLTRHFSGDNIFNLKCLLKVYRQIVQTFIPLFIAVYFML